MQDILNMALPQWELLPDIGLYMDQVITLMDRTFSPALPKGEMTKSMVNNYVKVGMIPRPVGKKYDREHLALLMMICVFKQALSNSARSSERSRNPQRAGTSSCSGTRWTSARWRSARA